MPRMYKWLGDLSEKFFSSYYKQTIVSEVEYYDKKLKRVRYKGEELKNVNWQPAQEIEFRVTDTEYRHYTPMLWNKKEGYTDVLFYLHNKGPGSLWADKLEIGDKVTLIGPAGKFVANKNHKKVIMMGDETSLSTYYGMQELLKPNNNVICVLEMGKERASWADKIGLKSIILNNNTDEIGKQSEIWLKKFIQNSDAKEYIYFLSGNANTIKILRRILIKIVINSKQIFTHPYWAKGKKGL